MLANHLRWLAALAVLLGHVRNSFFVPYNMLQDRTPIMWAFYFVTNFHVEAVLCFFVLSGMLVGGVGIAQWRADRFSPARYAIDRLTRLYVVLVPALVLSAVLFLAVDHGKFNGLTHCNHLTAAILASNLFYLQGLRAPLMCNNAAIWSLANEFWYYALFLVAMVGMRRGGRIAAGIALVAICALLLRFDGLLRQNILVYLPMWLLGLVPLMARGARVPVWLATVLFLAALLLSRSHWREDWYLLTDYLIGGSLALLMAAVARRSIGAPPGPEPWHGRAGAKLAGFSYSLYLTHFPVILALAAVLDGWSVARLPFHPGTPSGMVAFAALTGTAVAVAYVVYLLFERHTGAMRHLLYRWFVPATASKR